jgi:hypothetical protein
MTAAALSGCSVDAVDPSSRAADSDLDQREPERLRGPDALSRTQEFALANRLEQSIAAAKAESEPKSLVPAALGSVFDYALTQDALYVITYSFDDWTHNFSLYRCPLDGCSSKPQKIAYFDGLHTDPHRVGGSLQIAGDKVVWIEAEWDPLPEGHTTNFVKEANLDGSNVQTRLSIAELAPELGNSIMSLASSGTTIFAAYDQGPTGSSGVRDLDVDAPSGDSDVSGLTGERNGYGNVAVGAGRLAYFHTQGADSVGWDNSVGSEAISVRSGTIQVKSLSDGTVVRGPSVNVAVFDARSGGLLPVVPMALAGDGALAYVNLEGDRISLMVCKPGDNCDTPVHVSGTGNVASDGERFYFDLGTTDGSAMRLVSCAAADALAGKCLANATVHATDPRWMNAGNLHVSDKFIYLVQGHELWRVKK